jgi:hypothetical protein
MILAEMLSFDPRAIYGLDLMVCASAIPDTSVSKRCKAAGHPDIKGYTEIVDFSSRNVLENIKPRRVRHHVECTDFIISPSWAFGRHVFANLGPRVSRRHSKYQHANGLASMGCRLKRNA